jgi:hypothetical protein
MRVGLNSEHGVAGASASADARLAAEIADFFVPDRVRLEDRLRAAIARTLSDVTNSIEYDLRRRAARLLVGRGHDAMAEALTAGGPAAEARLAAAGLLRDPALMEEVIARTRAALVADALPVVADAAERPSLLLRLADMPDRAVAGAAQALLAADNRRTGTGGDLSADLHHRLVWWIAAAIREGNDAIVDRALVEAVQRCLLAHEEGNRPEALAARLVAAIDPLPNEVPELLVEALGEGRLTLFVAILAWALGLEGEVARSLVLEPEGERLWPALRAVGMARQDIARIALALAEADPRRDIEEFADQLDTIVTIMPVAARATIEPLAMPRDFRLAIRALEAWR